MGQWLIGYDIADPKRLQKVHRMLKNHATPIEYSVFLFVGTDREHRKCVDELATLIAPETDDLRSYPLPARGYQERFGRATLPVGIHWTGLPSAK